MATEKIYKALISGSVSKLDEAIERMVMGHDFHIAPAKAALNSIDGLQRMNETNPYRKALDDIRAMMERMYIRPEYAKFEDLDVDLEMIERYVRKTAAAYLRCMTRRQAEESFVKETQQLLFRLEPYAEMDADLYGLLSVEKVELHFGSIEKSLYKDLEADAKTREGVFLNRTGLCDGKVHCVYLALPDAADKIAEHFKALGLQYNEAPNAVGFEGVPAQRIREVSMQSTNASIKAKEMETEMKDIVKSECRSILAYYSWLKYRCTAFDIRHDIALKGNKFFLTGWISENNIEYFQKTTEDMGLDFVYEMPAKHEHKYVPVKFKEGKIAKIFSPFVEMYGHPAYGEVDPRLFMTITYGLLFGIMFGDIGQGAVLVLVGFLLKKFKDMWLGPILSWLGCFSVFFGCVYGSVFGNEHVLGGFKVMEGDNMMGILIITVAVGAIIIVMCMIMNIMTGFRQHNLHKALFSANGVCGMIVFIGALAGAVSMFTLETSFFSSTIYLVVCFGVPLFCMFCGHTLAEILEGHEDFMPDSWFMFFIEGFFEIFEAVLAWFSNCVSFLRVGAYAICHVGMMMVVYQLAENGDHSYNLIALVIGNIVVMVLEAVLVCIQVLRLEFYEMFGRFYTGLGIPFKSVEVEY